MRVMLLHWGASSVFDPARPAPMPPRWHMKRADRKDNLEQSQLRESYDHRVLTESGLGVEAQPLIAHLQQLSRLSKLSAGLI